MYIHPGFVLKHLVHHSQPQFIVFENGGKFKLEFKQMCENYGMKAKKTTSHKIPYKN
jgi:hypothetical protein